MKKKSFALGYSLVVDWFLSWALYNFSCTVSLTVYREAVAALHGYSTVTVLDMTTYSSILIGLILLIMPKLLSKFGTKQVYVFGAIAGGVTYMLTPFSPSPIVLGILIGLGNLWAGMYCSIGTMVSVSKWFPRKKGTVMGIITAAGIVSSGVMLPTFNLIYQRMGITMAMLVFGGLLVIYGIVNIFWMKDSPQEVGLMPDNMPMTPEEERDLVAQQTAPSSWSYVQLLKNGKFWLVTLGWSAFFTGMYTWALTSVTVATSNGMAYSMAIGVSSILGVCTFFSSMISGVMDTKLGVIKTTIIFILLMAVGMFTLGIGGSAIPVMLMAAAWILASGLGGAPNNLFSSQLLSMYGPRGYATAYSIFLAFTNLKYIGTWIDARSLQWTGSYNAGVTVGAVIMIIGLIMIVLAGQKRVPEPEPQKA